MFEGQMQKSFEAINRKDLAEVMRGWADGGVFEFPGHSALSGRYEGKPAIETFFRRLFEGLDQVRFTVRHVALANPIGLTYANTIFVEFDIEETSTNGLTVHNRAVGVYLVRHGKLLAARDYLFDPTVPEQVLGSMATPVAA